jgi:hypothetical protein
MHFLSILLSALIGMTGVHLEASAETCVPIPLVGGKGDRVIKTVSPPTIPAGPLGMLGIDITNNNWNTDWALPGEGKPFQRFIISIVSSDVGPFEIRAYLKYSDQTADRFFNQEAIQIPDDKPLLIKAFPRPNEQPYQVNLFVAGVEALGKSYSATVVGCY